jgi:hypothetical protein
MYILTVTNKERSGGGSAVAVNIAYSGTTAQFTKRFETTAEQGLQWLIDQAILNENILTGTDELLNSIPLGVIDLGSISAAILARREYQANLIKYMRFKNAIALGIITETYADYVTVKNWLIANFMTDYVDLF